MNAASSSKMPITAITASEFLRLFDDGGIFSALYVTETGGEEYVRDLRYLAEEWAGNAKRSLDNWGPQPAVLPKRSPRKGFSGQITKEMMAALAEGITVAEHRARLKRHSEPRNLALDMAITSKYVEFRGKRHFVVPDLKEEPKSAEGFVPQRALLAPNF